MSDTATKTTEATGRGHEGVARNRILDAASDLIYANGIRGTSADRVIEAAGISKVTFYRHFPTKTDLVVAYLERQADQERAAFDDARSGADPRSALRRIAGFIGAASCTPGFRGCAFINAAAETPDAADPVRIVVDAHRRWTRDVFAGIAADAGVPEPEKTARQLMMLRDGAMVGGYLGEPDEISETLRAAYLATLDAAAPSAS
ncbi:TetR/AcrR family transcriptional regulator [Galbitalea sp. SE-J8]|uniref:TetR/AcrR family transcriptional regulator n=1 Tax=Galbitalea sp. SE-J8 TaxID=3054952 RepID=UPI00259CA1DA|nr:TetR/AcrR family transcriptional regulator [Galbitalea sp. SE-J8]MDM4762326.1 TetR/AcrR family transcriptional regulator [Galbitalea sp. SE-J8]